MECSGKQIVEFCSEKIGQEYYFGAQVPLDDANWNGPWDCAELCSWAVYNSCHIIYGCTNNNIEPSKAEAWTGSWKRDLFAEGIEIPIEEAIYTPGAMLLFRTKISGHIAVSVGNGETTVEAKGRKYGVVNDKVDRVSWHHGILVPGINYEYASHLASVDIQYYSPITIGNKVASNTNQNAQVIELIKNRLQELGYMQSNSNNSFDVYMESAVRDIQIHTGLTPHGEIDRETAEALELNFQQLFSNIDR